MPGSKQGSSGAARDCDAAARNTMFGHFAQLLSQLLGLGIDARPVD